MESKTEIFRSKCDYESNCAEFLSSLFLKTKCYAILFIVIANLLIA